MILGLGRVSRMAYKDMVLGQLTQTAIDERDSTYFEMAKEVEEVYRKAKILDEVKKHIDEEVDSYMALYRQTKDPIYSLLNSNYDTLLGFIEELERADDER